MISPAMTLMTAAMMVAMMLPSVASTLWGYDRHLRALRVARVSQRTTLFAVGYASVWTTISLALTTLTALPAFRIAQPAPWAIGVVILSVGAVQRSRWKARRLLRCRRASVTAETVPRSIIMSWRSGFRFGVDCAQSCAAPMAVLCVVGLMDVRMMMLITAAITAERVARAGVHIARLTGLLALIVGSAMCASAI